MAYKNKEDKNAAQRRYVERNKEKVAAANKLNYEKNREYRIEYARKNRADPETKRWQTIKGRYNLTKEQYEDILRRQNNRCAGCARVFETYHVDHDHSCCAPVKRGRYNASCGKCVRGLLCKGCNQALGLIEDNIETMYSLIEYLKNNKREV